MRTARFVASAVTLLALILACGVPTTPPPPPALPAPPSAPIAPGPPGSGVPRAQFLASWTTIVVHELCQPQQYFRQCFTNVDEAQCTTLITSSANNCITQSMPTIPDPIPAGSGETLGQTLGACTGTAYEQAMVMQGRRIDSAICNDATHWM